MDDWNELNGGGSRRASTRIMQEERKKQAERARRGGDPPPAPAGMTGKASAEEVERWTTYKPAKPPGRS